MDRERKNLLQKLELLSGVQILAASDGHSFPVSVEGLERDDNPLYFHLGLLHILQERAQGGSGVYQDSCGVWYVCAKDGAGYVYAGPVCSEPKAKVELHRYYRLYEMTGEPYGEERHPPCLSRARILALAGLLGQIVAGDGGSEPEQQPFEGWKDAGAAGEDQKYHHTYMEESRLMECVRTGDLERVLDIQRTLHETSGVLSEDPERNQRYLAIVSVAQMARAAIAGGVYPAEAYRMSDWYIQKLDCCTGVDQIAALTRRFTLDFTRRAAERQKEKAYSPYTRQCREYVEKNYRRTIRLHEIAERIGISDEHLSRVFRKEMGITFQEYVKQFRVERASNLLRFSDASLTEIAEYVHFSGQSHFSSVFKSCTGMLPAEYRRRFCGEGGWETARKAKEEGNNISKS